MIGMPPMVGSACRPGNNVAKKVLIAAAPATRSIRRNALKLGYASALSQSVETSFVMLNVYTSTKVLELRRRTDPGHIQAIG